MRFTVVDEYCVLLATVNDSVDVKRNGELYRFLWIQTLFTEAKRLEQRTFEDTYIFIIADAHFLYSVSNNLHRFATCVINHIVTLSNDDKHVR